MTTPMIQLGKSFGDMILEVAERKGLANQAGTTAAIPSDPHDLDRVKRAVNRGYARFLRADPLWSFIEREVTVTTVANGSGSFNIDTDAGRYAMPWFVRGHPLGNWRYADETSRYGELVSCDARSLRIMREATPQTGFPQRAAMAPRTPTGGNGAINRSTEWELILYPTPDAGYTIKADFNLRTHQLLALEDRHIAGPDHDEAIIDCAVSILNSGDTDAEFQQPASLLESIRIDALNRGKVFGPWIDPDHTRTRNQTTLRTAGTVTHNGSAIP